MKKVLIYFFMIGFYAAASAADEAVTPSRALPSKAQASAPPPPEAANAGIARTAISRVAVQAKPSAPETFYADETDENIVENSTESARAARPPVSASPPEPDAARAAARSTGISRSLNAETATARETLESTVRNVGRNARTQSASMSAMPAVRRAGITLRPSTAEVGGRATFAGTDIQTGSNIRNEARAVQTRAAATKETVTEAKERLEQTADLNKSCQAQYNDCMDQFCAVIDTNQKRCSCSPNLSRYSKVETAVKNANSQLNEVAQRIRYIGLSADEIRAIMSATEAEEVLSGTRDNTESRNMLSAIEKLIKNPTSTTSSGDSGSVGMDMDLDFSGNASDLFNLDFLGNSASSFSNLRGTDLYNAAKKRCNTVIAQCKNAGATANQITGNYDLAIDKDCIAYEQGLGKMNETLKNNVRSADQMLKKARLAVLENKNQYDAKGCIGALNTCMTDDMVCGADYEKCLDPTKQYIDENGKVVLGRKITNIKAFMAAYANNNINSTFLASAKTANLSACATSPGNDGRCVVRYLLEKIGMGKTAKDGGLCRAVLDKCQYYTYNSSGVYNETNDVVVNYVQRAMVNVQAAQQRIIADYASGCMVDVAQCYNQQVSQVNMWSSGASVKGVYNVMRGACMNVALTCGYAVFNAYNQSDCLKLGGTWSQSSCTLTDDGYIDGISEMFYQSLLCPENSTYQSTVGTMGSNGYVNERCKCDTGYAICGKECTKTCNN